MLFCHCQFTSPPVISSGAFFCHFERSPKGEVEKSEHHAMLFCHCQGASPSCHFERSPPSCHFERSPEGAVEKSAHQQSTTDRSLRVTNYAVCRGGSSLLLRGLRSASLHFGPSHRFLRGLRPLVSGGPRPLPLSGGGQASQKQLLTARIPTYFQVLWYANPPVSLDYVNFASRENH